MNFKMWLEGLEEYEPYKKNVESIVGGKPRSLDFPFNNWWEAGQDRLYIPFDHKVEDSDYEKEIKEFINDFKGISRVDAQGIVRSVLPTATGYELIDYKSGLVRPIGSNRQYKVMKVLSASLEEDIKKLDGRLSSGEISKVKYDNEKSMLKKYYNDLIQGFQNDPNRVKKSNFEIVISKNPHDLASMSTGRSWTSCMNLKDGSNKASVYCELANGGFIAYLIRAEDRNIEHPLGRIHIRRFDKKKKGEIKSVAVPEETSYGLDIPEFFKKVQEWLDSKQGVVRGVYYRRGGVYSDTFGSERKTTILPEDTSSKYLQNTFYKYLDFDDRKKDFENNLIFISGIVKKIMSDSNLKLDADFVKAFVGELAPSYFGDGKSRLTNKFFNKNGHLITIPLILLRFPEVGYKGIISKHLDEKGKYGNVDSSSLTKLFYKRSDLFSDDDLKRFDMKIDKYYIDDQDIDPANLDKVKDLVIDKANSKIDIEKYDLEYFNNLKSQWDYYNDLIEFINKSLGVLKPIPPSIVRKFVNLFNNREKIYDNIRNSKLEFKTIREREGFIEDMDRDLVTYFVSALDDSKTDSPIALNWIDSILPDIDNYGGIERSAGYYLSKLGRDNGLRFLPTLRKQKEKYEQKLKESEPSKVEFVKKVIERYNYIIHSIENNDRSSKYAAY